MDTQSEKNKKKSKTKVINVHSSQFNEFIVKNDERIRVLAEKFADFKINSINIGFADARERVINWLGNFDKISFTAYELPLRILESFEFIKLFDTVCPKLLLHAKSKNIFDFPDTYVTHLGEIQESSYKLTSYFNSESFFSESIDALLDSIKDNQKIKIIHFDDFLNSGGQLLTIYKALLGIPLEAGEIDDEWEARKTLNAKQIAKLKNCEIHIFYYTAFDEGIEHVQKTILDKFGLNLKIYRHLPANLNDGAFGDKDDQTNIINGMPSSVVTRCAFMGKKYTELTDFYNILKEAGFLLLKANEKNWDEAKYHDRALGYGNYCRLVSTDFNIPSITLTAIWMSGEIKINGHNVDWNELLPRRKKQLRKKKTIENDIDIEDELIRQIVNAATTVEAKMISNMMQSIKKTVRAFMSLGDLNKMAICKSLGIKSKELLALSPNERDKHIFNYVNEKNLLKEMDQEIEKRTTNI